MVKWMVKWMVKTKIMDGQINYNSHGIDYRLEW